MVEVLKFSMPGCNPCQVLSKNLNGVEGIKNVSLDTDRELFDEYKIRKVPVLVFLKQGEEVHRETSVISKEEYMSILESLN
jgi:thioredoxin 1